MKQASKLHTDLIFVSDDMTGVPVTEPEYILYVLVELGGVIFQGNRVAPRLFVPVITFVVTGIFLIIENSLYMEDDYE